jgi:WD40 repeat protein
LETTISTGYASIAFGPANSPAGSLLTAAGNTDVGLWNVADPVHPAPFTATMNALVNILGTEMSTAVSPDGAALVYSSQNAANSGGQLCVLSLLSAAALSSAGGPLPDCTPIGFGTLSVAYTASGALLTGGFDGVVRLWRNALPQAIGPNVANVEWDVNPAGRMMATEVRNGADAPSSVQIWDIAAPGGPLLDAALPVAASGVRYVSDTVLLTFGVGTPQLWDLADPSRPVRGAALGNATSQWASVVGSLVAMQGADGSVRLWRVTGARDATQLGSFPDPGVESGEAGLIANGRAALALTASADTEWWDVTDPARPVRTAGTGPSAAAGYSVLSARGVAVIEGPSTALGAATLYVFDVSHGPPRTAVPLTNKADLWFDVSTDGRLLAATNADDTHVNLWDIADPSRPSPLATITAESGISGVALNPDGRQLALWNPNGALQLWDITNPKNPVLTATVTIAVPAGQAQQIDDVKYLPGGSKLLVSATGSVYVLDSNPSAIADSLCGYTGASVTRAQWQQYAPYIPYQNPCG